MKYIILSVWIAMLSIPYNLSAQKGRAQWTEEEAWEWHRKVGIIKGFNEPIEAYPGMERKEIFKKAAELGFNSVRFWIQGESADEQETYIRELAEEADVYGLTVSPVLLFQYRYYREKDKEGAKQYVQQLVGAFANDPRVILWDIWNEPDMQDTPQMYEQMDWIEEAVGWCREMSPIQPITSSIFWDADVKADSMSQAIARRSEVESLMDIHNFHHYSCADDHAKSLEEMVKRYQKIDNRPLICTEAITRTNGSGFPRTFVGFSEYHIHFYTWGLFMCDMNWTVSWGHSSYDPFEPMFHELLHPDGEAYDAREIDWLRNFRFAAYGENVDPGAEFTERWPKDRAWKWMVSGPIKGISYTDREQAKLPAKAQADGYNGVRVRCDYGEWKRNETQFYQKMDELLAAAEASGIRITPALLSDDNIHEKDTILADYVARVIRKYALNPHIQAWEIYTHPGKKEKNTAKLTNLLQLLFRYARFEFPNQPLTATPYMRVKDFAPDFKYREALLHGRMAGWNQIVCDGGSTPALCNLIWKMSDVISFSTNQKAPEAGWLTSIAFRYGRPLVCSEWTPPGNEAATQTLEIFKKSHVYWYNTGKWNDKQQINTFQFIPIITPKR